MIRWFISLVLISLCSDIIESAEPNQVANADSVLGVMSQKKDMIEEKLRYWFVDSLEKRMILSVSEKASIQGRGRSFRANFFDDKRVNSGVSSKLTTLLDSSFQRVTHKIYHSKEDSSVVTKVYHYQKATPIRIFAIDSVTMKAYKWKDLNEQTAFVNDFKVGLFKYQKKGNTNYHSSANTGDDGDDGLTWPDAWITLGAANGNLAADDSLFSTGEFAETMNPTDSGISGSEKITWMDSLTQATGGPNLTEPDTLNLWSTVVTGSAARDACILFGGDDFWDIIGIDVKQGLNEQVHMTGGANGIKMLQIRSRDHGDGGGFLYRFDGGTPDSLISSWGLGTTNYGLITHSGGEFYIVNNTFHGSNAIAAYRVDDDVSVTLKNNIFVNNNESLPVGRVDSRASVIDWDNNLWDSANTDIWLFNGADITTLPVWKDSCDNVVELAEANSLNTDPNLLSVLTTAYWANGEAQDEAAEDLGYGTDIGAWQDSEAAPPSGDRKTLPQIIQNDKIKKDTYSIASRK